jgi:hypothetical protein
MKDSSKGRTVAPGELIVAAIRYLERKAGGSAPPVKEDSSTWWTPPGSQNASKWPTAFLVARQKYHMDLHPPRKIVAWISGADLQSGEPTNETNPIWGENTILQYGLCFVNQLPRLRLEFSTWQKRPIGTAPGNHLI